MAQLVILCLFALLPLGLGMGPPRDPGFGPYWQGLRKPHRGDGVYNIDENFRPDPRPFAEKLGHNRRQNQMNYGDDEQDEGHRLYKTSPFQRSYEDIKREYGPRATENIKVRGIFSEEDEYGVEEIFAEEEEGELDLGTINIGPDDSTYDYGEPEFRTTKPGRPAAEYENGYASIYHNEGNFHDEF